MAAKRINYVQAADGSPVLLSDLPDPNQKRWVTYHKANLPAPVRGRLIMTGIAAAALIAVATSHAARASPILQVSSGILTGAANVDVDGSLYDVQFVDGTCASVFGSCIPTSFPFHTEERSKTAALALSSQVIIDGPAGLFDSFPERVFGCGNVFDCFISTPLFLDQEQSGTIVPIDVVRGYGLTNRCGACGPDLIELITHRVGSDTSVLDRNNTDRSVWAVWSLSPVIPIPDPTDIPEPSTLALFGASLAGLAAALAARPRDAPGGSK